MTSPNVWANLIQILHTNDIHSHLDHATHRPDLGGYPRLKKMIEEKRGWANSHGMGTIAMDAGDYLEGNLYYLAEHGRAAYRVHGSVGFDVSVIGNHDYLMGTKELDAILGDVPTSFTLLGANFYADSRYKNINNLIKPYWETVVNGVKVGVVGVTLDDILYKWRIENGGISDENDAVKKYAKILRDRGNEVIIALTHIGTSKDKKLAKAVPDIDIIIGGHSHDALHKVLWVKSKNGKKIPLVQAGKHAEWLGQFIFDYDKKSKKVTVAHYQLHPVISNDKDPLIEEQISDADDSLNRQYGKEWLNAEVGKSELRPVFKGGNSDIWLHFINDSMRETANADFAVHVDAMSGTVFPDTGGITRRDLYNSNPRTFEFDFKYGYNVYTSEIRGVWVALVSKVAMRFGLPLYFSGLGFDYKNKGDGKFTIKNLKSRGGDLKITKDYLVALNEGFVRGGYAITPWVKLLLKRPKQLPVSMWQSMEDHLKRHPVVRESYLEDVFGKAPGKSSVEHMAIPRESLLVE